MTARTTTLDWIGFALVAACLGVIQLSIFVGQGVLFTAAALVWVTVAWRDRRRPETPRLTISSTYTWPDFGNGSTNRLPDTC